MTKGDLEEEPTMQEGDTIKIGDEEFEVLSVYTWKQAIEDGVLVDISQVAPDLVASAGIAFHVAMTSEVWGQCVQVPEGVVGQDWKGRLWDILYLFRCAAKRTRGDTLFFPVNVRNHTTRAQPVRLKAVCGPGDDAEPCVTLMAETED